MPSRYLLSNNRTAKLHQVCWWLLPSKYLCSLMHRVSGVHLFYKRHWLRFVLKLSRFFMLSSWQCIC
jgi:hypothetical protein